MTGLADHPQTILGLVPYRPLPMKETQMLTTITPTGTITAQGPVAGHHPDRRATVADGLRRLTGLPLPRLRGALTAVALATLALGAAPVPVQAEKLLNVSYDPTREFYREVNEAFSAWWEAQGNAAPEIEQSHGGSSAQARAVIDGLAAGVVTLAMSADVDAIAERSDLIPADWQSRLPHNSSPYTSTIVFLVREGNPKGLNDWGDLLKDGVEIITPNPKTSGNGRWSYLAAWAWALKNGQDPKAFVGQLYKRVPVLDSGARGSTTTFAQRGIGDVLLGWENEAYLALKELGEDQFDIVTPSVSVLAEPPVSLVDGNLATPEERALAEAYLNFLYTPEGQALAFKHFYRAWDASAANPEDVARFPQIDLVTIDELGGWAKVQPEHFEDGGIFDQIYVPK
jgi:sulfate transport system substrate-binding protein